MLRTKQNWREHFPYNIQNKNLRREKIKCTNIIHISDISSAKPVKVHDNSVAFQLLELKRHCLFQKCFSRFQAIGLETFIEYSRCRRARTLVERIGRLGKRNKYLASDAPRTKRDSVSSAECIKDP